MEGNRGSIIQINMFCRVEIYLSLTIEYHTMNLILNRKVQNIEVFKIFNYSVWNTSES